jgi:hypothetical protein
VEVSNTSQLSIASDAVTVTVTMHSCGSTMFVSYKYYSASSKVPAHL